MNLPKRIKEIIGGRKYIQNKVGMSSAQVICFDDFVLKIEKLSEESENEYKMMAWLADKLPVAQVVCYEKDSNMSYLLMSRLTGEMSCSAALMENAKQLVGVLADGIKMFWKIDALSCPYCNSIDNKLILAEMRLKQGLINVEDSEMVTFGNTGFKSPAELLQWLKDNRPDEELNCFSWRLLYV